MKVLLLQDVRSLGQAGEIREVAEGYYRNYLLPRKLATSATEAALKQLAHTRSVISRRQAKQAAEAQSLAETISSVRLVLPVRVGEQHRLYGAVTAADVAEALEKTIGQPIDKRHIQMEEPIKHLGTYEVPVRLAKDVVPHVTVVVEREESSES